MTFKSKNAEDTVRLLSHLAEKKRLFTAFFANDLRLYESQAVQRFLSAHDCLAPYARKHPHTYLEAERVYSTVASAFSLDGVTPESYETVYCEFSEKDASSFEKLSLTLPVFRDENDYVVYSPENDIYQYGFYNYGKLRDGDPMGICPSGHQLIHLETQKEKRPRMILAGDAFTPFLVSYIAHHCDICLHAPIENASLLARDFSLFRPDVFLLLGGITLLENPILFRALQQHANRL